MDYIDPSISTGGNFGDTRDNRITFAGSMSGGGSSGPGPSSSPLALVPQGPAPAAAHKFPWWIVVVAIGAIVLFKDHS